MTGTDANGAAPGPSLAAVPEGLVSAVVSLVGTGPVLLGAYTIAELTAVDAVVDFLEARPSDEVLTEAVRSLVARQLIVAGPPGEQVQVRGDLGIAVAFEQRARMVMDARATPTDPGEPWRILVLPQPERICLVYRIDTFGVHQIGLYKLDEALRQLTDWLPKGPQADPDQPVNADSVLASAERSALITLTHYTAQGSAEIAGASTDLILARHHGRLHLFSRDPGDLATLVPSQWKDGNVHDGLAGLLTGAVLRTLWNCVACGTIGSWASSARDQASPGMTFSECCLVPPRIRSSASTIPRRACCGPNSWQARLHQSSRQPHAPARFSARPGACWPIP
jgi:hypothetical protein